MTLKLKTKRLKTIYDDVIIPSRHAYNRQRAIIFRLLRPIKVEFGIWGHILSLIGHIASER